MKIIRSILFVINIALAVALLATTVAGTFPPSRLLLPSLLAYAYLPLLVANVLMILLWLIMGKLKFLVSVAAIALRWSMVGLFFQVGGESKTPDRAEHPQMVTVMSHNVRMFIGTEGDYDDRDSIATAFVGLVREQQPDVLCLQEFAFAVKVNIIDSLTLMGYNHYYGTKNTPKGLPYATVVFSRLPITYVNCIDDEKMVVELLKDKQTFKVCNIHMESYRFDDDDREEINRLGHGEVQESSRRTLDKVKETLLCHEIEWNRRIKPVVSECSAPLLVVGDFNELPNSWLYSQLDGCLTDIYRESGSGFCTTYNGQYLKLRIDWMFHNDRIRPLSFRRLRTNISDHNPLFTSVEFVE